MVFYIKYYLITQHRVLPGHCTLEKVGNLNTTTCSLQGAHTTSSFFTIVALAYKELLAVC